MDFGDIDTDAIIPARYLNTSDPANWPGTVWKTPSFLPGESITGRYHCGRKNFGCGSSREHAPLAIETGITCIIAEFCPYLLS